MEKMEIFLEREFAKLDAQPGKADEHMPVRTADVGAAGTSLYTVEVVATLRDEEGRRGKSGRSWEQEFREVDRFTGEEARHYREALREQTPADNEVVADLLGRIGMGEWLEVRGSLYGASCQKDIDRYLA